MSENDDANKLQFRTPHILIKNPEACLKLKINVNWPACLESGGCLVACHEFKNIEMNYPDPGTGVRYNYG